MSLAEAAFLLSDEDQNKARSDSESLYKEMITQGIEEGITISVQINQENQFYYPQYVISVEVRDFEKFEKSIYKAAKVACVHTPIIVVREGKKFSYACAPGKTIYATDINDHGSLGCFLTYKSKPSDKSNIVVVCTCEHCRDGMPTMKVVCDDDNEFTVDYMAGILSDTADICLLKVRDRMKPCSVNKFLTDPEDISTEVTLKNFRHPVIGDPVIIKGAHTGYSEMVIKSIVMERRIDGRRHTNFWSLEDDVHNSVIAERGDSGSVVVKPDEVDGNIVGILFAVSDDCQEACMFDLRKNLLELSSSTYFRSM